MAVSGADWRKSTDGYWADADDEVRCGRPGDGEVSAVGPSSVRADADATRRTLADNTDNGNHEDVPNTVDADDRVVSGPLAIGVFTEAVLVAECFDDGRTGRADVAALGTEHREHVVDGGDIYLRYFIPGPGTRRGAVIVE